MAALHRCSCLAQCLEPMRDSSHILCTLVHHVQWTGPPGVDMTTARASDTFEYDTRMLAGELSCLVQSKAKHRGPLPP